MPDFSPLAAMPPSAAGGNQHAERRQATLHRAGVRTCAIRASVLLLGCALLAACAPAPDAASSGDAGPEATAGASAPAQDAPAPATPAPPGGTERDRATPQAGGTIGGDGSAIQLDPLTAADIEQAALGGELACSFGADGGGAPLLLATGVVASDEPARGVVKVAGHVEPVRAPGGFDGMLEDPTFTGQGKTVRIALTSPATGGGESPPRPATLTYLRADGASRTFEGQWQCGP